MDRTSWGADYWTVEETYGAAVAARHVTARPLAELVDDGYLAIDDALSAAASILSGTGGTIYRAS